MQPTKRTIFVQLCSVSVWLMTLICLTIVDSAIPRKDFLFSRLFNVTTNDYLNYKYILIALIIFIIIVLLDIIALIFNILAYKIKDDKISKSLILSLLFSSSAILFLSIKISGYFL